MIKKFFFTFLIFLIGSIIYLNYFGISTKKLNQKIQKKIQENYPQVNLKLNDIKILLNVSKLSIELKTEYPVIMLEREKIKLIVCTHTAMHIQCWIKQCCMFVQPTGQVCRDGGQRNNDVPFIV